MSWKTKRSIRRFKESMKTLGRILFGEYLPANGGHWKKIHYLEKWERG